jgi:hypothetical protein
MKNYFYIILITTAVLNLVGCISLRSGEGLSEGEMNINYIAPLAGSVRYGVANNIEVRTTATASIITYDIYLHTHSIENKFNFGFMLGSGFEPDKEKAPMWYGGVTASVRGSKYVTPYINLTRFRQVKYLYTAISYSPYIQERRDNIVYNNFLSVGAEM